MLLDARSPDVDGTEDPGGGDPDEMAAASGVPVTGTAVEETKVFAASMGGSL